MILSLPSVSVTPRRHDADMTKQLQLIESRPGWRLDRYTRDRGRAGVAAARAVIQESRARARAAALSEGEAVDFDHHFEAA